ncbi:MAG: response regulator [Proteobacteria bacterium]|nr:response regulator [Pseudomonadota bacterium]
MSKDVFNRICFYYPIKVIFLDDNKEFLNALELGLDNKINMHFDIDPLNVLEMITNQKEFLIQKVMDLPKNINIDFADERLIGFDISKLVNILYNQNRFNDIKLLVIDYEMPEINGLEFCNNLKENKILKIMLTAAADKDTAISAFNNGLINRFLLKTSKELYSELTNVIDDLTFQYFRDLSHNIIDSSSSLTKIFENKSYQKLFNKILEESNAIEYYLIDSSGSMLFLDCLGKPTWLIIKSNEEIAEQIDLLQGYEVSEIILNSFKNKEKLLFIFSETDYKKPIDEWECFFLDTQKMDDEYCFSIVKNKLTTAIEWDKIVSYSEYKGI